MIENAKTNEHINLRSLKSLILRKYPNSSLSKILIREPDEINFDELMTKIATWQTIVGLDGEQK